jgi:hypothetical protein
MFPKDPETIAVLHVFFEERKRFPAKICHASAWTESCPGSECESQSYLAIVRSSRIIL